MSQRDSYFQFPIVLLRHYKHTPELIQDACSMALLNYGNSLTEEARQELADQYVESHPAVSFPDDDDDCLAVAAASMRLHVNVGNIESTAHTAWKLREKHGEGMQVRLRTDIAWSAHDDMWPLLKLKTLCGVYAGIGNRHTQKLNHRLLRAYCSGHSSPKGLKDSQLIPTSSMRYWLEQLWFGNLFQFCLHGQERWYSHSCKDDRELARLVKAQKQTRKSKTVIRTDDV